MAMTDTPKPPTKPRWFVRVVLPLLIIVVAVTAVIGLRFANLPRDNFPLGLVTFAIFLLTGLLLSVWLVLFSGWKWWVRWGLNIGIALLVFDSADWGNMHFDGDVHTMLIPWRVPIIHRFFATQDDVLEADRKAKAQAQKIALAGVKPTDFPAYRGQNRDGIVTGPALPRDWSQPPKMLWKQPAGGGFSGFAVVGDQLVTMEQRRDNEAVVAYDAVTGQERWVHAWPGRFKERMGGDGPRATPTIYDRFVYALGGLGNLVCLDASTGELQWQQNILQHTSNLPWAMSGSPLVFGNLVVVNPGAQDDNGMGKALAGYDRLTGELKWQSGNTWAGYSSPMLATLAGQEQIVLLDGQQVGGFDPATGIPLWSFPWKDTMQKINVAQPVVLDGDRVYISSGYGVGGAMLKVSKADGKWSVQELWRNKELKCKFSSPVYRDGHLYGLDEGILVCLDAKDGKRKWRGERYGHGQVLLSGDLLVILSETGLLALVEAKPGAFQELGSFRALDDERKNWNPHALANGKVFVRNHEQMAGFDLVGEEGK